MASRRTTLSSRSSPKSRNSNARIEQKGVAVFRRAFLFCKKLLYVTESKAPRLPVWAGFGIILKY